jgi:NitT/TauT family transport system permease protein/taurine transport system permease protein
VRPQINATNGVVLSSSRASAVGDKRRKWAVCRDAIASPLALLFALIAWQLAAVYVVRDEIFLPSPVQVAQAWWHYMRVPYPAEGLTLWRHALVSIMRVGMGFGLGVLAGICIGALMTASLRIRSCINPLLQVIRPLPPIAFVPLLIVWLGIGETPKIVLIIFVVTPLMAVSTAAGIDEVPPEFVEAARCLGASARYALLHVRVRAALPAVITGMRLGMGIAWASIVAVELVASMSGLGFLVLQAGTYLKTPLIFAGIITIGVLGFACDTIFRYLQRKLDPSKTG